MKFQTHSLVFALILSATVSNAAIHPFKRVKSQSTHLPKRSGSAGFAPHVYAAAGGGDDEISMDDVHDLIYLANITVGGSPYVVQLDTGSSDLWIKGQTFPLPSSQLTTITYNISYGIGWANGTVSYSPVEFAGIKISSQAFLDVASVNNPVLSYNANGIAGLGFTSLSTVDALVNQTGAASGRSMLYNAFVQNPQEPNYIAFSLQSSADSEDEVVGTFSIGETVDQYASVLKTNSIPTFPVNSPTRWSVLLDGLVVGGQQVSVSSTVQGAPSNQAVVVLDTGTSYTYTTEAVCNAIYGSVPGAYFDSTQVRWVVPCATEIDVGLQIAGTVYPLHPLDVTPSGLTDPSQCVGSFIPQGVSVGGGEFDWLVGDNVLRSLYTVYDFGDFDSSGQMGNPYVKLLSVIDPQQASVEFHDLRGGSPLTNITYNAGSAPGGSSSSGGGTASVNISDDLANTLSKIGTFFPALLAIMALNALVILLLLIAAGVYMWRRRTRGATRRVGLGRALTPMPGARTTSYDMPSIIGESHTYQPVSMALTEDTFVPPSPAFQKGDRPNSVA
ncbi:hypothetical protein EUX98_g579 [Antrodiella citrinella]|uniref:Peptidase A1 domain-containing protein n=1 Tax=Antrodiella citrinella TaxID=2447956 RepID=A0A4V3XJM5_9APHY|nr:hypothetical protein EUX98_g579 [Antrodiella citrinella]